MIINHICSRTINYDLDHRALLEGAAMAVCTWEEADTQRFPAPDPHHRDFQHEEPTPGLLQAPSGELGSSGCSAWVCGGRSAPGWQLERLPPRASPSHVQRGTVGPVGTIPGADRAGNSFNKQEQTKHEI